METTIIFYRIISYYYFVHLFKKKKEETKDAIEWIKTVEPEIDKISEKVDQKIEELEWSLKDLDGIILIDRYKLYFIFCIRKRN